MQYVSDYFNEYLSLEDYSYELMKLKKNIKKSRVTLIRRYPETHQFIEDYYLNNQKRIDTFIGKVYQDFKDVDIFYRHKDFEKIAEEVVINRMSITDMKDADFSQVIQAVKEYRNDQLSKPLRSEIKELDNSIVKWIFDSYNEYGVNLSDYAFNIAWRWSDKYTEYKYIRSNEESWLINSYDYRYQENPFDIDNEYKLHKDLPFMTGKRDYLEMLVMYHWLFNILKDTSYWPEYVQLCITQREIDLKSQKGQLMPVKVKSIEYPEEIQATVRFVETKTGLLKAKLKSEKYILSLVNEKGTDNIWINQNTRKKIVMNLKRTFEKYGYPEILELQTPFKSPAYGIKELLDVYTEIQKELKLPKKNYIALKTASLKTSKEPLIYSLNDVIALYQAVADLKLDLKIILDFVDNRYGRNILKKDCSDLTNILASNPNLFIGFHINQIDDWGSWKSMYSNQSRNLVIDRSPHPTFSEFMSTLSMILQDSNKRYLIPQKIKNTDELEKLTDVLYRCGCVFI